MEQVLIEIIRGNSFMGLPILVESNMGVIHCPIIKEMKDTLFIYNNQLHKFANIYDKSSSFLSKVNELKLLEELKDFASNYYYADDAIYQDDKLVFIKNDVDKNKMYIIGIISNDNICDFMDTVLAMNHIYNNKNINKEDEDAHLKINDDDSEWLKEFKRKTIEAKKKYKQNITEMQKQESGIGIFEILSSVAARSQTISPLNIKELNYFQLIEHFRRLTMLDSFDMHMNALSYGNIPKEEINKIEHYTKQLGD